jgi:hypothetical protein
MKANKTSDPEDLALMTKLTSASKLQPCEGTFPFPVPSRGIKTRARAEDRSKKGHSYKPLPVEFRAGGFNYRQIAREGDAAIYEQTWGSCSNPSVCYEVIRIRRRGKVRGVTLVPYDAVAAFIRKQGRRGE